MTPEEFKHLALQLPGTTEGAHMGHTDFRVNSKIFATMGYPKQGWAMVSLDPVQQEILCAAESKLFQPANGAWGRRGATIFQLETATQPAIENALRLAWTNKSR